MYESLNAGFESHASYDDHLREKRLQAEMEASPWLRINIGDSDESSFGGVEEGPDDDHDEEQPALR